MAQPDQVSPHAFQQCGLVVNDQDIRHDRRRKHAILPECKRITAAPRAILLSIRSSIVKKSRNPRAREQQRSAVLPFKLAYHRCMKFHTEHLTFHTKQHREYINITAQVESALTKSGVREGMILVSAMHITAGVWVNDAEDGLIADIDEWLEKVAPFRQDYRHHQTGETNGDSHLKSLMVHHQVIVPATAGNLAFGPWQQIYYAEFDGQRSKRVIIKCMGE